jgi:Protein of unknown function (DUF2911)
MPRMKPLSRLLLGSCLVIAVLVAGVVFAQGNRPMSPRRTSSAHVLGAWTEVGKQTYVAGGGTYSNGKWIEISYGSPIKRGRTLFGTGANYAKAVMLDTPIWRAGADVTTRLKSEVPLKFGAKVVPAGEYSVFIDLKENDWTFVLSSWPAQQRYDANNKTELWGSYGYTPDKDVARAKMKLETLPHSHEQLSWEFVDVTRQGGALALTWDKTMATVPFAFGG